MTAYGGKIEYEVQFWKEGPPSEIWSKSNVVLLGEDGAVSASSMNEDRSDRPLRVQLQVVEVFQFDLFRDDFDDTHSILSRRRSWMRTISLLPSKKFAKPIDWFIRLFHNLCLCFAIQWKFLNAKGMQVDREEFLRVLVKPRGVYVRLTTDIPTRDAEFVSS